MSMCVCACVSMCVYVLLPPVQFRDALADFGGGTILVTAASSHRANPTAVYEYALIFQTIVVTKMEEKVFSLQLLFRVPFALLHSSSPHFMHRCSKTRASFWHYQKTKPTHRGFSPPLRFALLVRARALCSSTDIKARECEREREKVSVRERERETE